MYRLLGAFLVESTVYSTDVIEYFSCTAWKRTKLDTNEENNG